MTEIYLFWGLLILLICFVFTARILKKNKSGNPSKFITYFLKVERYLGVIVVILFLLGMIIGLSIGFPE